MLERETVIDRLNDMADYLRNKSYSDLLARDFYDTVGYVLALLKDEPVKPIKTCKSKNELGVDGILITGHCPECDQRINNRDNKFCGGCGRHVNWE